jgi:hypothetical protein
MAKTLIPNAVTDRAGERNGPDREPGGDGASQAKNLEYKKTHFSNTCWLNAVPMRQLGRGEETVPLRRYFGVAPKFHCVAQYCRVIVLM